MAMEVMREWIIETIYIVNEYEYQALLIEGNGLLLIMCKYNCMVRYQEISNVNEM